MKTKPKFDYNFFPKVGQRYYSVAWDHDDIWKIIECIWGENSTFDDIRWIENNVFETDIKCREYWEVLHKIEHENSNKNKETI